MTGSGHRRVSWKPNVLAIVPPYTVVGPPAGAAALLGYLRSKGCNEFDFLDLRLWVPSVYSPTYRSTGAFGETYVMDIPDLPLVLKLVNAFEKGTSFIPSPDADFEQYCAERLISVESLFEYLTGMERYLRCALSQIPDLRFVGFSVWTSNYLTTLMAAAMLKRRVNPPYIVAGGPQVTESTASARLGLKAGLFDAVVQGEGEETLGAVFESFSQRNGTAAVPGTMTMDESGTFIEAPRPLLPTRDLPAPCYEPMDLAAYAVTPHGTTVLYQLSRGCTDKCTFCSEWVFWQRFRSVDPLQSVEQLSEMQRRYGFDEVLFTDSLLNGSIKRLRAFAEGVLQHGLKFSWGGFMRAQMDGDTLAVLKRAGLQWVNIGIESLADPTLLLMNKRRSEADNIQTLRLFLENGIVVQSGVIPGFPRDTRARFLHTIQELSRLKKEFPDLLSFTNEPFTVSPAQPIYKELETFGLEPVPWAERYLEIAPGYRSITGQVFCSVQGSNQGVERLGQSALIPFFDVGTSTVTPFSYSAREKFSTGELDIQAIEGGSLLARCKTPSSLVYGCILTADERRRYLEALETAPDNGAPASCVLDVPGVAALMKEIEQDHLVPPDRNRPSILPIDNRRPLERHTLVALSPHVVARLVQDGRKKELVLANCVAGRAVVVSSSLAPLLQYIHRAPRRFDEVRRFLQRSDVPLSPEEWLATAEELSAQGFVVSLTAGQS